MADKTVNKPVRLNIRVSHDTNEWLDKKAEELAITKTALVVMAIEQYRKEFEVSRTLPDLLKRLDELGIKL